MKILITGASGTIGRKLVPFLEPEHELRLLSLEPVPEDSRWAQADITKLDQILPAMQGMEAVIHLAIASGHEGGYEEAGFNEQRFDVNVKGTFNVFEAARRAGVRRVIHTSSLTVVWGYPPPEWVASDAPAKPVGTYGLTKFFGEKIAEHYATAFGMDVVCLRISKPIDIDDPRTKETPLLPQWIAFPDILEAYRLSLVAPVKGIEIVTVVGESRWRRWDLLKAERLLGYRPSYRLEELGYTLCLEPKRYSSR